jgi:hypothetical protein
MTAADQFDQLCYAEVIALCQAQPLVAANAITQLQYQLGCARADTKTVRASVRVLLAHLEALQRSLDERIAPHHVPT